MNVYTVVCMTPQGGRQLRDSSVVHWVAAPTPTLAGYQCRHNLAKDSGADPEDFEVIAVFVGTHDDQYEENLDTDEYAAQIAAEDAAAHT